MSVFGKILTVLNLLLVAGFLYVAVLDYVRRQVWADNYVQYELVITGLPLDDKELDPQGNPRVESLRQDALSKRLGGTDVVKTQAEELTRIQKRVQASIDDKPTPRDKAKRLIRLLAALADTQPRREQLVAQFVALDKMADAEIPVDALQKELDKAFTRVRSLPSAKAPDQEIEITNDQRKMQFADLLFRLCEVFREDEEPQKAVTETKAYERFLAVVGVATASRAVEHYAANLQEGVQDVADAIAAERERFALDYKGRLAQLQRLKDDLDKEEATYAAQHELLESRNVIVANRKALRDELAQKLKEEQEKTAALLARQKFIEESLYKSRQELRDAFAENQRLEQLLRTYEQGR